MSKTVEELQAELDALQATRSNKEQLIKESTKEINAINYRQNQLATEIEKMKRESGEDLEAKFNKLQAEVLSKIETHLDAAKAALNAAKKVSEETGIPFESSIVDLSVYQKLGMIECSTDVYVPKSCHATWEGLMEDGIHEFLDAYCGTYPHWENYDVDHGYCLSWATSSMRC